MVVRTLAVPNRYDMDKAAEGRATIVKLNYGVIPIIIMQGVQIALPAGLLLFHPSSNSSKLPTSACSIVNRMNGNVSGRIVVAVGYAMVINMDG